MNIISTPSKIDFNKLDIFIKNHPNGNFFQSSRAYTFFNSVEKYKPIIIIIENNNELVGSLIAVIMYEGNGLKAYLSKRCIIWGGPLSKNNDIIITELLLKELNTIVLKGAIYIQLRNFFNTNSLKNIFNSLGYIYEEHLNIIIDLKKSSEQLWKDVHSKRRNEIRRAKKEGTSFQLLSDYNKLQEAYNILLEVYKRAKLPLPSLDFFETAYEILGFEHFKIFIAINDNKIIGTMFTLCYNDTIYDWYAGSYQKYYKKYPNDLIPWEVFIWGKENGYTKFDFGGAGKPDVPYGVRDYKKKFGGLTKNYGRYEKITRPFLFQIAKQGFKLYQKLRL